jgi:hypothetical protein
VYLCVIVGELTGACLLRYRNTRVLRVHEAVHMLRYRGVGVLQVHETHAWVCLGI